MVSQLPFGLCLHWDNQNQIKKSETTRTITKFEITFKTDYINLIKSYIQKKTSIHSQNFENKLTDIEIFKQAWVENEMSAIHQCCPAKADPSIFMQYLYLTIIHLLYIPEDIILTYYPNIVDTQQSSSSSSPLSLSYNQRKKLIDWNQAVLFSLYFTYYTQIPSKSSPNKPIRISYSDFLYILFVMEEFSLFQYINTYGGTPLETNHIGIQINTVSPNILQSRHSNYNMQTTHKSDLHHCWQRMLTEKAFVHCSYTGPSSLLTPNYLLNNNNCQSLCQFNSIMTTIDQISSYTGVILPIGANDLNIRRTERNDATVLSHHATATVTTECVNNEVIQCIEKYKNYFEKYVFAPLSFLPHSNSTVTSTSTATSITTSFTNTTTINTHTNTHANRSPVTIISSTYIPHQLTTSSSPLEPSISSLQLLYPKTCISLPYQCTAVLKSLSILRTHCDQLLLHNISHRSIIDSVHENENVEVTVQRAYKPWELLRHDFRHTLSSTSTSTMNTNDINVDKNINTFNISSTNESSNKINLLESIHDQGTSFQLSDYITLADAYLTQIISSAKSATSTQDAPIDIAMQGNAILANNTPCANNGNNNNNNNNTSSINSTSVSSSNADCNTAKTNTNIITTPTTTTAANITETISSEIILSGSVAINSTTSTVHTPATIMTTYTTAELHQQQIQQKYEKRQKKLQKQLKSDLKFYEKVNKLKSHYGRHENKLQLSLTSKKRKVNIRKEYQLLRVKSRSKRLKEKELNNQLINSEDSPIKTRTKNTSSSTDTRLLTSANTTKTAPTINSSSSKNARKPSTVTRNINKRSISQNNRRISSSANDPTGAILSKTRSKIIRPSSPTTMAKNNNNNSLIQRRTTRDTSNSINRNIDNSNESDTIKMIHKTHRSVVPSHTTVQKTSTATHKKQLISSSSTSSNSTRNTNKKSTRPSSANNNQLVTNNSRKSKNQIENEGIDNDAIDLIADFAALVNQRKKMKTRQSNNLISSSSDITIQKPNSRVVNLDHTVVLNHISSISPHSVITNIEPVCSTTHTNNNNITNHIEMLHGSNTETTATANIGINPTAKRPIIRRKRVSRPGNALFELENELYSTSTSTSTSTSIPNTIDKNKAKKSKRERFSYTTSNTKENTLHSNKTSKNSSVTLSNMTNDDTVSIGHDLNITSATTASKGAHIETLVISTVPITKSHNLYQSTRATDKSTIQSTNHHLSLADDFDLFINQPTISSTTTTTTVIAATSITTDTENMINTIDSNSTTTASRFDNELITDHNDSHIKRMTTATNPSSNLTNNVTNARSKIKRKNHLFKGKKVLEQLELETSLLLNS